VSIQGNGPVRVSHQSVIAKEGKPFRIVVDCLAARHSLAQKDFASLPISVVTALRTSQYAVKPEEIVRVVIDLAHETVYRVETAGTSAKIFVSDPKTAAFAEWTSSTATNKTTLAAVAPPKTAAQPVVPSTVATAPAQAPSQKVPSVVTQKNADQPAETKTSAPVVEQTKPSAKSTPATSYAVQPTVSDNKPAVVAKLEAPNQGEQAKKAATEVVVAKTPTPATNPAPAAKEQPAESPAVKDLPPSVMADLAKKTNQVAWLFGSAEENKNFVPTPGDDPGVPAEDIHKAAIGTPLKPPVDNTAPVPATAAKPSVSDADQALAVVTPDNVPNPSPADDDAVAAEVSAADLLPAVDQPSKYRRDAAKSAIRKQTQVVEFPKRFVTTYEAGMERDPFETLVDETKPTKGSLESRMANVETLLLVGVLESETGRMAALLEDLDGIGYILKPGDPVKNGYVSQIDNSAVYFQINEYGWSRTIVKELDKEISNR
ncbi:MAG: hypothetical protein PHR28_13975, partial [candidate division Zixibacteria bacterium]|nr:hypothetical protein [candidate division Zixibacteria bacterium]